MMCGQRFAVESASKAEGNETNGEPDPLSVATCCLVEAFSSPYGIGLRATREILEWEPLISLPLDSTLGVRRGQPSPFSDLDDESWLSLPWSALDCLRTLARIVVSFLF